MKKKDDEAVARATWSRMLHQGDRNQDGRVLARGEMGKPVEKNMILEMDSHTQPVLMEG